MRKANFLSIFVTFAVFLGFACLAGCAINGKTTVNEGEYRTLYCHFDGAFKLGMNDALAAKPMHATVTTPCAPETRPEAERGYREGFTQGIGRHLPKGIPAEPAPPARVTEVAPPPVAAPSTPVATCASAVDCRGGQFCKARPDKILVCMGDGKHGDFCESNVDCRAGFCRATGDGLKRCMNSGGTGAICANSTDCAAGLLCRATDTPLKTCN